MLVYCSNCGNKLKEKDSYCTNCGAKIKKEYQEPRKDAMETQSKVTKNNNGNTSLVLGVISFLIFWIPYLSIPLAIISIILGKKYKKETGLKATGSILGMISLILSIIEIILIVVCMLFFIDYTNNHKDWEESIEESIIEKYRDYWDETEDSFDIKGYSWIGEDSSILYLNKDNSYTWYQSDAIHDDNFYTGNYEVYTGIDAINYITNNLKEYGITEEEQKSLFKNSQYELNDYYLLILNCTKIVINGTEQVPQKQQLIYYGLYDETSKSLALVDINTKKKAIFTLKEKINNIDL